MVTCYGAVVIFDDLNNFGFDCVKVKYNADLIPDLLNGIGTKFGVATDEGERVVDGLGNEDSIEWIAMM